MPRPKIWGGSLGPTDVADRLVRAVPTTKAATPPIQWRKFCTNGSAPSAQFANLLHEATNSAALFRGKQVFSKFGTFTNGGTIAIAASAVGTRNRWRFAFRTGPYTERVMAVVVMTPPDTGTNTSTASKLTIYSDANESTSVGTANFYYGTNPGGSTPIAGWQHLRTIMVPIEGLSPSTDYYGRFDDISYGRLASATVFELPSLSDGLSGYLPQSITSDSEVLSVYRENVAKMQKALWKNSGGTLLTWTRDLQASPRTIASATPTNIIDGSSTTVSSSTPGFYFDCTGMDRLSQTTGVPFVMKVCAYSNGGAGQGRIYLKNSAGSTVCSISAGWSGAPTWQSVTGVLPASSGKYDIQFDSTSGAITFWLNAVSIYPYEA